MRLRPKKVRYYVGERAYTHRRTKLAFFALLILVIIGIAIALHFLRPNTNLGKKPAAVTRTIRYDTALPQRYNQPLFSINLPADWKSNPANSESPTPDYIWQGTTKDDVTRWLAVYVDRDLSGLAVNAELHVQGNGRGINVLGDVSPNCISYTKAPHGAGTSSVPSKWQNIPFLCDTGNYERDVVGTVSPDGLNTINFKGTNGVTHHFFIVYTDSSYIPDYRLFQAILKTFQFK